jgi:hypothetical protein
VDAGASYEFVLRYDYDAPKYPYISHILKAYGGPYLAVSFDDGATWRDDSALLPGMGSMSWSVASLAETTTGQFLIAVEDDDAGSLYVSELRLVEASPRRRAVRR